MKKKDNWLITVFILTFVLSIVFSTISNVVAAAFNAVILFIIMLVVIIIGIIFDMIGTASIAANEATFHSMSSARIKGAKECINLIRHSDHISSFCNDVVGDVCGIVSGGLGAMLAISLANTTGFNNTIVAIILAAFISSLTVGGKAIFKRIAISHADKIIHNVGKIKYFLHIK